MTIDDKTRDENLQYDINRETAKISALSSRKIDKYKFLTGEEMSDRTSYVYLFSFGKSFWKKLKIKVKSKSNHLKSMRKNQLNLMNLLKRILDRDSTPLDGQKKRFNKLVEEKSYGFQNLKEKINPNNLIYNYKTEGKKSERSWWSSKSNRFIYKFKGW